jgi:hypothetical protein
MKVLVFVKATPNSEKGLPPAEDMQQLFADMGRFNDELVKAGIMGDADGLKPSSFGKRVVFNGKHVSVVDGPFAETKELVAGYWVWNVKSMDEALEWAKRCPNPMPGEEGVIELRPVYAMEDFGELVTPELRAQEERQRKVVARQQQQKPKLKARAKAKGKAKAKAKAKAQKRQPSRAKGKK